MRLSGARLSGSSVDDYRRSSAGRQLRSSAEVGQQQPHGHEQADHTDRRPDRHAHRPVDETDAVLTRRDRPVPRGPIIRAVAVAAFFVLLTSVSARSQPIAAELQRNWQGKVMDLLWVVILCMILHRWARQETGLLRLPAPGSRRVALRVVGGVSALFVALGLLAELFPDREVVGLHCLDLVLGLGSIHCSTHHEPLVESAE